MALLSNGNSLQLTSATNKAPGTKSTNSNVNETNTTDHFLFSSILNTLPRWGDSLKVSSGPMNVPQNTYSHDLHNDDYIIGNSLGAIGSLPTHNTHDLLGGISLTPSTSPQTSSSTSSHHCISSLGAICGRCDSNGTNRCLDCNDILCDDCVQLHQHNSFSRDHCIIPLATLSPIGSSANISNGSNGHNNDPQCDIHGEVLRYVCESCKKIVCQECTLWEHKDHNCIPVGNVAETAKEQIQKVIESGKLGNKYIKASIDRAVQYSQAVERDALEASSRIRKAMRHFIMAAEERERVLLEKVDKYRQQKLTSLSDQMAGLRAALAGLAQTSEMLSKGLDSYGALTAMEIVQTLTRGESQMEQFAAMYKNLQPKEEFISFITPNFELLQEIRVQGDVVMVNQRIGGSGSSITPPIIPPTNNILTRRPIVRALSTPNQARSISAWDQVSNGGGKSVLSTSPNSLPSIGPIPGMAIIGQCIPGYHSQVSAKPSLGQSTSFAFDGHEDGQVSRPWGLCVDKDGNIIVADRRNNRIQVFYSDGTFKSKFGSKGTGNGQFDLPAGISTDPQNRIVVVDKDNHRVQIFTSTGIFILKFGSYGKDCGQFQYPWDIGVNSKGEMLVTDSRNHRIQLFNPDGHFISRFSFDGVNHSRSLKGLTTPRGVCFTPQGDVIISDFENHRLLLIDSTLTKILSTKGHEGNGIHEFSRPSGICCDDDGRVIVADSKNQRILIFSSQLEFLWAIEIRPSSLPLIPTNIDEKDRPSDVALLPDGRLVVMVETSPDARDVCNPHKTFVQIY